MQLALGRGQRSGWPTKNRYHRIIIIIIVANGEQKPKWEREEILQEDNDAADDVLQLQIELPKGEIPILDPRSLHIERHVPLAFRLFTSCDHVWQGCSACEDPPLDSWMHLFGGPLLSWPIKPRGWGLVFRETGSTIATCSPLRVAASGYRGSCQGCQLPRQLQLQQHLFLA